VQNAILLLETFPSRDNVDIGLKLFDYLILPILRYGCEVWAPFTNLTDSMIPSEERYARPFI
jgi:hypothetical protein